MVFLQLNEPFAISGLIILMGYLLKRLGIFQEAGGEILAKAALNFTLPAVILLNIPKVAIDGTNILLPFIGLGCSALMALIGVFVFRGQSAPDRGLSMTAASGYNIGLFAIPLVAGLYGPAGIARFALFDLGNAFAIFGLSWFLAWYYSPCRNEQNFGIRGITKMFFGSIPFLAYLAAIAMNLTGLHIEGFAARFLEVPAAMNRGVSLLALGVLLRFRFPGETWKAILPSLVLRYSFGITVGGVLLFLLPIGVEYRVSVAGALIMPVGLAVIPYAVRWGYDRDRAAAILNLGIPVSFVLFWLIWVISSSLPSL
jgi:predicted permease